MLDAMGSPRHLDPTAAVAEFEASFMDAPQSHAYHRTTIYLTEEQRQWLTRLAAQARLEGSTLSASDVIRYP
jgi:hypothetical protein